MLDICLGRGVREEASGTGRERERGRGGSCDFSARSQQQQQQPQNLQQLPQAEAAAMPANLTEVFCQLWAESEARREKLRVDQAKQAEAAAEAEEAAAPAN